MFCLQGGELGGCSQESVEYVLRSCNRWGEGEKRRGGREGNPRQRKVVVGGKEVGGKET